MSSHHEVCDDHSSDTGLIVFQAHDVHNPVPFCEMMVTPSKQDCHEEAQDGRVRVSASPSYLPFQNHLLILVPHRVGSTQGCKGTSSSLLLRSSQSHDGEVDISVHRSRLPEVPAP